MCRFPVLRTYHAAAGALLCLLTAATLRADAPANRSAGATTAETWPQWRGPKLDGTSPATNLPLEWSETKNIRWKAPLPSWGGATPIVWGDRVFIVSPSSPDDGGEAGVHRTLRRVGRESPGGREILLMCLHTDDGRLLWKRTLDDRNVLYGKQNMASPSPVTDGRHVWTLTGTGVLTAFDMDGERKWRVDLQESFGDFRLLWGYASSPLLYDGMVIVQVLHGWEPGDSASYLAAFDAVSGELRWRQERHTDATRECPDAYTTPAVCTVAGRTELIVTGANYITAHDPAGGAELWRSGGLNPEDDGNYRIVASPLVVGDVVIAPTRVKPLLALRAGGKGDVTDSHRLWALERYGPDVPTPVSDGRRLYLVDDRGIATCVDLATGEIVWGPERTAQGTVSASPLLADGRLYITNESAVTTVLAAGAEFRVLATNEIPDPYTLSSLAVGGSRLYLRTSSRLYCIEQQ